MKTELLLFILGAVWQGLGGVQCKRPPWYKPCWIYLCGLDVTNPVCAWDPHRGARLFRNPCELERHNFCYNRNYATVDADNTAYEDAQLCTKLTSIVQGAEAEGGRQEGVVEDGNVRVHFVEDHRPEDRYNKAAARNNRNDNFDIKSMFGRHNRQSRMWTSSLDSASFSSSAQDDLPFRER